MTSVTVPDVGSIQFHPIIPAANLSKEAANKIPEFPLAEIPYKFQLDHIHTNFVQVILYVMSIFFVSVNSFYGLSIEGTLCPLIFSYPD